ncbi:hypothetical protein ACJJTC_009918 [Scirpophaga incertulas]
MSNNTKSAPNYGTQLETQAAEANDDAIDLDDLLPKIGEFGLYQKLLLWLVCLPACLPCGFCAFNQLFMTDVPDHWCKVPQLASLNISQNQRKSLSIPYQTDDNSAFEKCVRYAVDWVAILQTDFPLIVNRSWPKEPCLDGYEYDTSEIQSSVVMDFDLVCDYDVYPTLGLVALNVGGPVALELAGPNYRSFVTVMTCIFYTLGLILLSLITYLLRDWRSLALATSVPFLFYYFYWFVLPESPRWLLMRERLEEANTILKNIARVNKKELPEEFTLKLHKLVLEQKERGKKTTKNVSVFTLFRTPNMRLKTCLITLNWCASEMVYVGLSYYGPAIGNDQYMSFFLSSAVEIPSYLVCWLLMDRVGRRWPLCLSMVISGIFCIATVMLPNEALTETLILYLISKCFISASFLIIYPYAGELYPTELRGVGIGTSAYIGGLGLIIIPFVNYLGASNLILPLVVMGVLSVIGGISCLRLPETLHTSLPQTAEEGEEFGKNWTYKQCFACGGPRPADESESYENIDHIELTDTPLVKEDDMTQLSSLRRSSMRKLIRQTSIVETQRDRDGNIKMAYWF